MNETKLFTLEDLENAFNAGINLGTAKIMGWDDNNQYDDFIDYCILNEIETK